MSAQGKWRVEPDSIHGHRIYNGLGCTVGHFGDREDARAVVVAHNAQCEAEPFAWHCNSGCRDYFTCDDVEAADWKTGPLKITPLYTAPPPPASAVAKVEELREQWIDDPTNDRGTIEANQIKVVAADEIIRILKEAGL